MNVPIFEIILLLYFVTIYIRFDLISKMIKLNSKFGFPYIWFHVMISHHQAKKDTFHKNYNTEND